MKLNIGDKVRFLNESIEGTIASVLSHGRVEVLTLEEVQNDLNESSSVPKSSSPPPVQKSSIPIISSLEDDNTIYAAIRLLDEKNPLTTDVEIFLLNNTDYSICFTCLKRLGNFRAGIHSGVLNSNHESLIGVFSQDEIYRFDGFEFQFLFH